MNGDILQGHYSVALSHVGNIAHRVGQTSSADEIRHALKDNDDALETFTRFQRHLEANKVDLRKKPPALSPWLTIDNDLERFIGTNAEQANHYLSREYRRPFVVPTVTA